MKAAVIRCASCSQLNAKSAANLTDEITIKQVGDRVLTIAIKTLP